MTAIFSTTSYTCTPATITYDDDDRLITIVMTLGSKGTCTFKTDNTPNGNNVDDTVSGAAIHYRLRTGGQYAIVTMGDPTSAVAVAYNGRIRSRKFDEGDLDWTMARSRVPDIPSTFRSPAQP
ncbi:unnamed protein product [Rhizoctonia solani]|uniref:Uncharacterized protein n=1 Tax=Rhizoctonia solani TaxID=456999 RepID=A0A8H3E709_9AGAM|nr:unnamed protein product [Rhizoctonia solani]